MFYFPRSSSLDSNNDNKAPPEIIGLEATRAIAVGPPDMHGETGELRFTLDDEEYRLRGILQSIPNFIVPRIKPQHVCYAFAFVLSEQDHDRLADQIDRRELWRFFGSLSNYPYKLPPGGRSL